MEEIKKAFNQRDITAFIKYLVELGGVYQVGEDLKISHRNGDELVPVMFPVANDKDEKQHISIYSDRPTPNTIVLNPFAESIGDKIEQSWFYESRRAVTSWVLRKVMSFIIEETLKAKQSTATVTVSTKKGKKKADEVQLDLQEVNYDLIKITSPYINDIDEVTKKEFDNISSKYQDLFKMFFLRKQKLSRVSSCLFDEDFVKAHPSVRQKTWKLIRQMFMTLVDIKTEDLSEYDYTSTNLGAPQFEGLVNTMYRLYRSINEVLLTMGYDVDIHYFESCIKMFNEYQTRSFSVVSPSAFGKSQDAPKDPKPSLPWNVNTPQVTPAANPWDVIRGNNQFAGATPVWANTPQMNMMPQPQFNNGFMSNPMMQQQQMMMPNMQMPVMQQPNVPWAMPQQNMFGGNMGCGMPGFGNTCMPFQNPEPVVRVAKKPWE